MLILLCVCEGQSSKTWCFSIAACDFFTTAPRIKNEMLELLCVSKCQFSNYMCFAIAACDFFTTAPCITKKMKSLTLLGVFDIDLHRLPKGLHGPSSNLWFRTIPILKKSLEQSKLDIKKINYIFISLGPGSFTGIRLGIAAAKGLGIPYKIKISGYNNMNVLAHSINDNINFSQDYLEGHISCSYAAGMINVIMMILSNIIIIL